MKTFDQLTPGKQLDARTVALDQILRAITEGGMRFSDAQNHDDLQARVDAACEKAESMQTPWFAHEYIMDTCADDLRAMAQANAEDALYPNPDEQIIRLT